MKKIILFFLALNITIFAKSVDITLESAINMALEQNNQRKISKIDLEIAKAQYEQAISANLPSIDSLILVNRDKKPVIFQQRGTMTLPPALGGLTISTDANQIVAGRDTVHGKVEATYPLYTGGKISSIVEQAKINTQIKNEIIVRDETSIIFDVKKYFYGYVMTNELFNLVNDSYKDLELSSELTESFIENSTLLKLNRTDLLDIKLLTSMAKNSVLKMKLNRELIKQALINTLGLKHNDDIIIKYDKFNLFNKNSDLNKLIEESKNFNSDMKILDLVINISKEKINEAKSDYLPTVGLFANASHTYNSYKYGILNADDANRWSIGVAVNYNLYNGSRTKNKVLEEKLTKRKYEQQKIMLEDGLSTLIKNEFLKKYICFL